MRYLLIFELLMTTLTLSGQYSNIGTPFIQPYTKQQYRGGTQNWGYAQDQRGILYVANNEGLLEFNGREWTIYPLPNRTIARSVAIDAEGRIFTGGQDEVGYFSPDDRGVLQYHSIKDRIGAGPAARFEDVWDLIATDAGVFFRASDNIYRYYQDSVTVFSTGDPLLFLGGWSGQLFVQDAVRGLLRFEGQTFVSMASADLPARAGVTEVLPYHPDTLLFATEKHGLFYYHRGQMKPWVTPHQSFLEQQRLQAASMLPGQRIALATAHGGLLILSNQRKALYWLEKEDGLQNNNIRSVFTDREHNLWLGLDNGMDYVLVSAPFRRLIPDGSLEGTAYAVQVINDKIYFGTSNGLYESAWQTYFNPFEKRQRFRVVPQMNGQVWGLNEVQGALMVSHHEGAFRLEGGLPRRLSPGMGYWMFLPLSSSADLMLGGHYYGLSLYRRDGGRWAYWRSISGLKESCRILAQTDEGDVWVSHPYRGIFVVRPEPDWDRPRVSFYGQAQGLPSDMENHAFYINGEVLVCGRRGVYRFVEQSERFMLHPEYTALLGSEQQVRRLQADSRGNVWYVMDKEVGVLRVRDKGLQKEVVRQPLPALNRQLVGGFELIYPYDAHHVFFGAERGFIHYQPLLDKARHHAGRKTIISRVYLTVQGDSLLFGGHESTASSVADHRFSSGSNAFRFHYATPFFEAFNVPEYQYRLEGLEKEWSAWTEKAEREYTNLPYGKYRFLVRSRIAGERESAPSVYSFEILPPWYAGKPALAVYGLLVMGFLLSSVLIPRRTLKKERAQMMEQQMRQAEVHREMVKQSEEEIIRLQNEKLEAEVAHKNKEMASVTMHLLQKSELLHKMGEELEKLTRLVGDTGIEREIRKLMGLLQDDSRLDSDWEMFAQQFDQVHIDFFKRLREKYPLLTPRDLKLCAYLRLNLTSKEIAPMLNISVRGVEISRYRLRKKLQLDNDANLTDFLIGY